MSEQYRRVLMATMRAMDGPTIELAVERGTFEPGRSFSADALEALHDEFSVWVGTRIMRRWDDTNEPPTALSVTVTVTVQ